MTLRPRAWIAGVPVPPLLTAAQTVAWRARVGGSRPWFERTVASPDRRQRRLVSGARRVRLAATEHDVVPWAAHALEGLTRSKARAIRDTLWGYPVRYWTLSDPERAREGVFGNVILEGEWTTVPMSQAYDFVFYTDLTRRRSGPACGTAGSHVVAAGGLLRLEVLEMNPWDQCEVCGRWRPRALLYDASRWFLDDPELVAEYRPRLLCRNRTPDDGLGTGEGYCE